jgi:hypothetical protein
MTVSMAGLAIKPDLRRTTKPGIRARTIRTASSPAPIVAHIFGSRGCPEGAL